MKIALRPFPVKCDEKDQTQFEVPTDVHPKLRPVVQEFEELSSKQVGQTNMTEHAIDTGEAAPIKVPPRQIPSILLSGFMPSYKTWPWKESSTQAQAHGARQLCMY